MKVFYDKIVELHIGEVVLKIEEFDISNTERNELLSIVDSMVHHRVLDVILDKLEWEDEHIFLASFSSAPHNEGILEFLKEKNEDIEEIIQNEAKKIKEEIFYEVLHNYN